MAKYNFDITVDNTETFSVNLSDSASVSPNQQVNFDVNDPVLAITSGDVDKSIGLSATILVNDPVFTADGDETVSGTSISDDITASVVYAKAWFGGFETESSSSFEVGYIGGNYYWVYFHFDSIAVANGSTINDAYITLDCASTPTSTDSNFNIRFVGDKSTSEVIMPTSYWNFVSRPQTSSYTNVTDTEISTLTAGDDLTIDVTSQVQEIVNMSYWTSGYDMGLWCHATTTGTSDITFDNFSAGGDRPSLNIDYT